MNNNQCLEWETPWADEYLLAKSDWWLIKWVFRDLEYYQ